MGNLLKQLADKVASREPEENPAMLVSGQETTENLKDLIIELTQQCPWGNNHFQCPFRILSGLTHGSIIRTVQALSRESCLELFKMERECRAIYAGK